MTQQRIRHGMRSHPLYGRWVGMRQRCNDPNHIAYHRYGGAGITVCERWSDFRVFVSDMGLPPFQDSLIDRIDSAGPYAPWNCRWASPPQQNRNKSSNCKYTHQGKTMCVSDWAKNLGLNESSLRERLAKWPPEKALSIPKLANKGRSKNDYTKTV